MIRKRDFIQIAVLAFVATLVAPGTARAQLVLSELVVELHPSATRRHDIEVENSGTDMLFVAISPREVIGSGTSDVISREEPDPEKLGLLVSPARMVLEPGKRKLLRIAALTSPVDRERVYRVTLKPVVGRLVTERAGLKVLVGYEVLVLVRPLAPQLQVTGTRSGNSLTLRNSGNASVELLTGRLCEVAGEKCHQLPSGRLYAGAEKTIAVASQGRITYVIRQGARTVVQQF